ncbi:hypothetical protein EDD22DRAFT_1046706 [Suillus occidentalis]|nr:hypothetical protein EDD22DRAFT_1046706 [Suillus occidentalis]
MYSTDNDYIASQYNATQKTPTAPTPHIVAGHDIRPFSYMTMLLPGPQLTASSMISVCSQHAPSPPQLSPESWGVNNDNRNNEVIARSSKRRQKEDGRKETLENDEYTDDVPRMREEILQNDKLTTGRDWFGSSDPEGSPAASPFYARDEYEYLEEEDSEEDEGEGEVMFSRKAAVDGSKHYHDDSPRTLVYLYKARWKREGRISVISYDTQSCTKGHRYHSHWTHDLDIAALKRKEPVLAESWYPPERAGSNRTSHLLESTRDVQHKVQLSTFNFELSFLIEGIMMPGDLKSPPGAQRGGMSQ